MENINFFEQLSESLRPVIRQEVHTAVKLVMDNKPAEKADLMRIDEACEVLHLKKPTVYKKVYDGILPFTKKYGRLYFSRKQLLKVLENEGQVQ